ncbi:hypothetical protein llap_17770 [Limosa lapponica baueri]|uniref:Uncharacterized protein n=1 Tax=Limosa lapponica baueri TaxID=1758121 RepID=A0A2I0TDT2_LIMLA|nr:hypothetical protein llap_17770 [Limosa lapponica baueri]
MWISPERNPRESPSVHTAVVAGPPEKGSLFPAPLVTSNICPKLPDTSRKQQLKPDKETGWNFFVMVKSDDDSEDAREKSGTVPRDRTTTLQRSLRNKKSEQKSF